MVTLDCSILHKTVVLTLSSASSKQVKVAKRVAVVGGGPTGVELAAELRVEYPDMEVTLVHGSEHLLTPDLTAKGQARLQDMLTKDFKIRLVLGQWNNHFWLCLMRSGHLKRL